MQAARWLRSYTQELVRNSAAVLGIKSVGKPTRSKMNVLSER
jgi:hypothetical protein